MGGRCFQAKSGNGLWFAVIEELKVLLLQIVHDFAVLIADNHADQHYVYADCEGGRGIASDDFGCRRLLRWSLRSLCWRLGRIILGGRRLPEKRTGEEKRRQGQKRQKKGTALKKS